MDVGCVETQDLQEADCLRLRLRFFFSEEPCVGAKWANPLAAGDVLDLRC